MAIGVSQIAGLLLPSKAGPAQKEEDERITSDAYSAAQQVGWERKASCECEDHLIEGRASRFTATRGI
jgi:hypothetical protein